MVWMYALLFAATYLANKANTVSDKNTIEAPVEKKNNVPYILLTTLLVCFVGLRTSFNDTYAYIVHFEDLKPFKSINWSLGSYPLFNVYQSIIKKYISDSASSLIFITAVIVICTYIGFVKKYSADFGYSIFLMIAMGIYGFTAGAMKQTLSIALALIATDRYLSGKRIISLILFAAAVLFHPYVLIYAVVPFLEDDIWNKRTLLIIIFTVIIGSSFSTFIDTALEFTDAIGKNYSAESFEGGSGGNVLRFAAYSAIPVLSFIFRKELRKNGDKKVYLAVNLSLIASCLSFISLGGGAQAIGRMVRYIDIFQCICLPFIVDKCIKDKNTQQIIKLLSIVCFLVYYFYYFKSYVRGYGWFADYYEHISIIELFKNW